MTRFHFERPDGITSDAQNILIHLNEFVPPQGFSSAVIPPTGDSELFNEGGSIGNIIWNDGIDTGLLIISETP